MKLHSKFNSSLTPLAILYSLMRRISRHLVFLFTLMHFSANASTCYSFGPYPNGYNGPNGLLLFDSFTLVEETSLWSPTGSPAWNAAKSSVIASLMPVDTFHDFPTYSGRYTYTKISSSALDPALYPYPRLGANVTVNRKYEFIDKDSPEYSYTENRVLTFKAVLSMTYAMCPKPACPAHASGTPPNCTCDAGYKFDAAGTSCVPLYTITLHGLGGEVMPTETRDAFAAVAKSDGKAAVGVQVGLQLTVIPEEDGYNHAAGQHTAPHEGKLLPKAASTDGEGKLHFVFEAGEAGGTHTIAASCGNCAGKASGEIKVPGCSVDPLPNIEDIPPNGPDVLPLTLELDRTKGATLALLPAAQAGVNCIKSKNPSAHISSGTRTVAYQQHFIDIWNKMIELNKDDNRNNPACKSLRDKVIAEKGCDIDDPCPKNGCIPGSHCLRNEPAINSKHPTGNAFDVSDDTIDGILTTLRPNPPPNPPLAAAQQKQADIDLIADWLASPPVCNLVWGWSFGDRVHFQTP